MDILTARNTEQNAHLEREDSIMEEVEEEDEDDSEIKRLEEELAAKQRRYSELYVKKGEHLKISEDIKNSSLKNSSDVNSSAYKRSRENIEKLEKEKENQKRRLNDYETVLISLAEDRKETANPLQKPATTREIYTGFRARIEKLLKSQPTQEKDYNMKELTSTFRLIETELKEILDRFKEVELAEKHMSINK